MRIAQVLIACLLMAGLAPSAVGQQSDGYGAYAPGGPAYAAGYGPGQFAGYPMQQQGYPMQQQGYPMQSGYGMPMMQSAAGQGYGGMPNAQSAAMQQPGDYYAAQNGQPYVSQDQTGEEIAAGTMDGMSVPMDGQMAFGQQMQCEPQEAPVAFPQLHRPFTWVPPPTGSKVLAAMGPPYAALQDSGCCDPGLLGNWGQVIRSRVGQFYIRAEAMMMRRSNPGGHQPLFVTNLQLPNSKTAIATNDLAFLNEIGQRMTVGIAFSERSAFEVTYLGLQNNIASASATGPANLSLAGDLSGSPLAPDFIRASAVSALDATMLQSLEFNYVATTVFERLSLIGGFRYFDIKDSLDLTSSAASINGAPGFGTGTFAMNTLNQLYGGQAGFLFRQNLDLFTVELRTKAGVYENYATQSQILVDQGNPPARNGFGSRHTTAFVGDLGLSGIYHFSNFLALRFGYNVMFIDNLAMAPDQTDFTLNGTGGGLNHQANLFLYGVNLGLDARF